jgi:hypothetical protein
LPTEHERGVCAAMPVCADIYHIRELVVQGRFSFSQHAIDELRKDGLCTDDALEAILRGEVAEDASARQCCVVSGTISYGFALHVVVDYRREARIVIATAYIPEDGTWVLPRAIRRR